MKRVLLAHGDGGLYAAVLLRTLFMRYFKNRELARLSDAALLPKPAGYRWWPGIPRWCHGGRRTKFISTQQESGWLTPGWFLGRKGSARVPLLS